MAELSQHPDVVDLAEYAEDLLDPARRDAVEHHVRHCSDCAAVLSDLAALPQVLADAPLPSMPVDVADRLDRAIAAESEARARGWSGAAAKVTPLRPKRRWLAPVVSAAAVVGAIAIAVPVLNNGESGSDDSGASEVAGAGDEGSTQFDEGVAPNAVPRQSDAVALTSDSFGQDVIDAYYAGSSELRAVPLEDSAPEPTAEYYDNALGALGQPCDERSLPRGTVVAVTYDGRPALLLRREIGATVEAIAYSCAGDTPEFLDAVTLRPRT
jgi:hypothetical protein